MNQRGKRTILLVEDEVLVAVAEKQQLAKFGYSVEHVRTGEAAVTAALSAESAPDLILMDIDLGEGIDGTEAARRILSEIEIPVVFLSSHIEPEIVEKTEKITSYGYVVKNSGVTVLDASIKMAFKLFSARKQEQKHEAALLHSRDLMRYVIEHNRSAVAIHDKGLNYIYVSKQYLDQFNVKDRNIIGKHHYEVFPDLPQKFRDAHQRALRGESSTGEDDPYEHEDGTIAWTRWECRPWYEADDSIGGFIVYTEVLSKEPSKRIKTRDTVNYLQSILRTTRDGFAVLDMNGNFVDVNDAYCKMCGYSRQEFLQLSIPDIAVDEDPELTAERLQHIKSNGHALFHARNWRKDGTTFDVEVGASFLGGEEDRIIVFFRDITERKQAEKELKERELLLRKILDNSVDLISICDLDGTFRVTSRSHELLGLKTEALIGKNATDFVHPDDAKRIADVLLKLLRTGEQYTGEYRYGRSDGDYLWLETHATVLSDAAGNPEQILFSSRNITERKRMENDLRESEEEYRLLFETMSPGVVYQAADGTITTANPAAEEMMGLTVEQMNGRTSTDPRWRMLDEHGNEVPGPVHPAMIALKTGEKVGPVDRAIFVPEQNEYVWLSITAIPLFNPGAKEPSQVYTIFDNITKRRQAEEEIHRQLAEKETLLKEVHHRIKNNMVQVAGLLLLQSDATDNPHVQTALKEAISRVHSIRVLYDKLLLGKDYQDLSVKDYVESLVDSLVEVFAGPKNIEIETKLADLTLSSERLIPVGMIINELLTNIFKYAFTGRPGGHVVIQLDKTETHATLIIADNGVGLDAGNATVDSTGFGLSVVQMLVEQLKGTYAVDSNNGTKCVVEFQLHE